MLAGRHELARHELVALAVNRAALGMADDRIAAADVREHRRRNLAGMRPRLFGADVLAPETHAAARELAGDLGEVDERRAEDDFAGAGAGASRDQLAHEARGFRTAAVHLPVAGNERLAKF